MAVPSTNYAINPDPLARFFAHARKQRCAITGIENSNGYYNTSTAVGRVGAQRKAFAAAGLVAWGSHLMTMNGWYGASAYPETTGFTPVYPDHYRDAPAKTSNQWLDPTKLGALHTFSLDRLHRWGRAPDSSTPWNSINCPIYNVGTAGVSNTNTTNGGGVILTPVSDGSVGLLDWEAALTVDFWYSDTTPTGGRLTPVVTNNSGTPLSSVTNLTISAGTPSSTNVVRVTKTVSAGSRGAATSMRCRWANGTAAQGSNWLSYVFVTQDNREYGLAYGSIWGIGGTSIRDFVWATQGNAPETTFTISAISTAAAPVVTTSTAHGFENISGSPETEFVEIKGSNSTPSIDGFWCIGYSSTTAFSIIAAPGLGTATVPTTTVAGTTGTVVRLIRPIHRETLMHHFQALCQPIADKNQEPRVCIRICDVLNSRNETTTSPYFGDTADSAAAFKASFRSAIGTIMAAWMAMRWTMADATVHSAKAENIVFWFDPDHPPSASDSEIDAYIAAAGEVAAEMPENVTVTRTDRVVTYAELLAGTGGGGSNSYYQSSGTDTNHLTKAGYEFVEGRKVAAVLALPVSLKEPRLRGR